MKRTVLAIAGAALLCVPAYAQTLYQTYPGTSVRDYSKPGLTVDGNTAYQTHPGTSVRDYSKPGYKAERGYGGGTTIYQTHPGTSIRDYSKPGYVIGR